MYGYQKSEEARQQLYAKNEAWRQTQSGRLAVLAKDARNSSKKRGHVCEITRQHVIDLWDRQQGLCAYTGWPMDFATKSARLVSIERIDNTIGYRPDNILLVCWCVNKARSGMSQADFFDMCRDISARQMVAS